MKIALTKAQLIAVARRVAAAFLLAAVGQLVGSGALSMQYLTDLSLWQKAAFAGVAAILTLIQSVASQWLTGAPTVTALLAMLTTNGRQAAKARKTELLLPRIYRRTPPGRFYGKQAPAPIEQCARLDKHLAAAKLPTPPKELNWVSKLAITWGMMLNDRLGDCTCAAVGHAIQVMTALAGGRPVTVSDGHVLRMYEAVSGYNPRTGANDNGAVEATVLLRWRRHGLSGHKITAYGRVDHTNLVAVKQTIALFGFAYIGTMVPKAWELEPHVWGVPKGKAAGRIVGGHAVILVGWDETGFWLISWGQIFKMTFAAFEKYVDEVWGVLSPDWIEKDQLAPSGLNVAALLADLQALPQGA